MYGINDVVTLKKQHPCGGKDWKIVRLGADVKIQCATCGKYVNLTRDELKRRVKSVRRSEDSYETKTDQG
ncbi:MAG: DUF951 domain-containing protein [Clostridia bacterium]|nr:DUF951 domain-containing protein [Clostridia bacterium]